MKTEFSITENLKQILLGNANELGNVLKTFKDTHFILKIHIDWRNFQQIVNNFSVTFQTCPNERGSAFLDKQTKCT
jgi:hypothetical protein